MRPRSESDFLQFKISPCNKLITKMTEGGLRKRDMLTACSSEQLTEQSVLTLRPMNPGKARQNTKH